MSKKVGKIVGVKPTGIQILIEHLTAQEASGSSIVVGENADIGAPQAYVLAIGPGLEEERDKLGFKVGDRVVVQGKYIPLPKPEGQKRELGVIDHVNIKAVVNEEIG